MAGKFDQEARAKAVRLVVDHVGDYDSEWAAITAVSKRLGMSAETLRKWIRSEPGGGDGKGGSAADAGESRLVRDLKRKNAELERTIEILKAATTFSRGSAARTTFDLSVHRGASRCVRSRTDLSGAVRQ